MSSKPRWIAAAAFITLVAGAQLLRAAMGWKVAIEGYSVPFWFSYIAAGVLGVFAVLLWRDLSR